MGDTVWIQHIEAESEEAFECVISEVGEDPKTKKSRYRLQLADGGKDYEKGAWLSGHRLHDSKDQCNPGLK